MVRSIGRAEAAQHVDGGDEARNASPTVLKVVSIGLEDALGPLEDIPIDRPEAAQQQTSPPREAEKPPRPPDRARGKLRVQLDLDEVAVQELDEIKNIMGGVSRAEVVRMALLWIRWTMLQLSEGASLVLAKDGKEQGIVVFPFLSIKGQLGATRGRY